MKCGIITDKSSASVKIYNNFYQTNFSTLNFGKSYLKACFNYDSRNRSNQWRHYFFSMFSSVLVSRIGIQQRAKPFSIFHSNPVKINNPSHLMAAYCEKGITSHPILSINYFFPKRLMCKILAPGTEGWLY